MENTSHHHSSHQQQRMHGEGAYIRILEQPASRAIRFRYECEGRSAGSIPGVSSTTENKTYPTIQIVNYVGRAVVVVSCVTIDQPYRPHPHNLVGKERCKKGICTADIKDEAMVASFTNLGIQCVKKKDIEEALRVREEIRVDPFATGFAHRNEPNSINLNVVRLCFQAFLEGPQRGKFTCLKPVVSEPIYDKKAMSDLVISKLSHCAASVAGGTEVILLCEKVNKEDVSIRFFEEREGQTVWEGFGDFTPSDVHKQYAISFRTPRYKTLEIEHPVQVNIELRREKRGDEERGASEPLPFLLTPLDSGRASFWSARRHLHRGGKADYRTFASILQSNTKLLTRQRPATPVVITLDAVEEDTNNNKATGSDGADGKSEEVYSGPGGKDGGGSRHASNVSTVCTDKNQNYGQTKHNRESVVNVDGKNFGIYQRSVSQIDADDQTLETTELPEEMEQEFNDLMNQVNDLDAMYNTNDNDFGVYSSLQMAMKNPCEFVDPSQGYEDVCPPRPSTSKPIIAGIGEAGVCAQLVGSVDDDSLPPLPPKRVKKTAPSKTLPPVPEGRKMNIFQKLFSPKRKNKSREGSIASFGSKKSLVDDRNDEILTEAEHYALYTTFAPHATASEFDEMSSYYSPVEGRTMNSNQAVK